MSISIGNIKHSAWRIGYRKWRTNPRSLEPGYTVILPVPGDLPVFLHLALESMACQDASHLAEVLVVPDKPSAAFTREFHWAMRSSNVAAHLVKIGLKDRVFLSIANAPHAYHFIQLLNGIEATRTTHVLLHDADLFLTQSDFLRRHYEQCVARGASILGVEPVWDEWFRRESLGHVVATWEMMASVSWLRQFPPHYHESHSNIVSGKPHMFDTMLFPQCLTDPGKVQLYEGERGFVHFNYTISSYRGFKKHRKTVHRYEDTYFRLLLIRLLIDLFGRSDWKYELPTIQELTESLRNSSSRISYKKDETATHYPEFREMFETLITLDMFGGNRRDMARRAIEPFDKEFKWG